MIAMRAVSPQHAALAAIREDMGAHPLEHRRDFPADEVKPADPETWRARQREYARREAVLRACWRF